ncbi:FAD-dependent oxidoreductase [Arthrobacter sp. B0490]|uniref:FAD-dependent oxidoreductase n=1 Tax=Arthrobacter sp. B0490 TaxID=2058891 RepID=UPI000CE51077|nr:FAD-dependent oxidoreductase [Arthrobacter sp. B0490]
MTVEAEFDVVIVGSGAGGMTAALAAHNRGLSCVVIEAQDTYGGTTAVSGGIVWVPANHIIKREGSSDTPDLGRTYVDALIGDQVSPERRESFLEDGRRMLFELEQASHWFRFHWAKGYPDYYPELPGGLKEGRAIAPELLDAEELGGDLAAMTPSIATMGLKGLTITPADFHDLNMATRTWSGKRAIFRVLYRTVQGKFSKPKLTAGRALVGRLRLALRDAGIPLYLSTRVVELTTSDEGGEKRVSGVKVQRNGVESTIVARRAVIIAAGGFGRSQQLRDEYHPSPSQAEWTMTPEGQDGDGIAAGLGVGAAVELMDKIWGQPSTLVPADGTGQLRVQFLHIDRANPSTLVVNGEGKRYYNESAPYTEFANAMYVEHAKEIAPAIPSWMIFDHRGKRRYMLLRTFPMSKFPKSWTSGGYVKVAQTVEDLAAQINVPAQQLAETLRRYSSFAKEGVDEDFGKGSSVYGHYYGDPTLKNPNLAPIDQAPFYAVAVYPGDVGTKGGLKIDERSRVLSTEGKPIAGLYAGGNSSGSVMGDTYPGAGSSIGAAMVNSYSAVLDIVAGGDRVEQDTGREA